MDHNPRFAVICGLAAALLAPAPAGAQTYLGEIRTFALTYCPAGYLPLDGRTFPITDDTMQLFHVLQNRYGGDGTTTFALPTGKPLPTLTQGAPLIQCIALSGQAPTP